MCRYFGHRGVSSNCLLDYGKITGFKEAMPKYARLDNDVTTGGALTAESRSFGGTNYGRATREFDWCCVPESGRVHLEISAGVWQQTREAEWRVSESSEQLSATRVVKKTKNVTIHTDPVVNLSAGPHLQSSVVLEGGSGSEDSLTNGRRKRKRFESASDGEDLWIDEFCQ